MDWSFMRDMKIVRLNARLFPVKEFERALYARFNMHPIEVEAATPADIIPHVHDCDAAFAISVSLPVPVIDAMDKCRVISRMGTGTDKIAVDRAKERGIIVSNVPYFCIEEQADHTMALLLSLVRGLTFSQQAMLKGDYRGGQAAVRTNRRLNGRTIGLVGFGNSAKLTARRAKGFGMHVLATRLRNTPDPVAEELGVEMVDLDTLLRRSNYVSLHLPLGKDSYHLIDAAALAKMKPDAMLINTSRGALVDEPALLAALERGHLAGAGLDTDEMVDVFADVQQVPGPSAAAPPEGGRDTARGGGIDRAGQDVGRGAVENVASILAGHWPLEENIVNAGVEPRVKLAPSTHP